MGIYRVFKPWLGVKKNQKGLMAEKAEMAETEGMAEVTVETVESVESGVGIADREGRLMR